MDEWRHPLQVDVDAHERRRGFKCNVEYWVMVLALCGGDQEIKIVKGCGILKKQPKNREHFCVMHRGALLTGHITERMGSVSRTWKTNKLPELFEQVVQYFCLEANCTIENHCIHLMQ